ncbi:M16 family metallopeptidase [Rubinisphaera brasiliensis]|uniref:Processing peptidase n=1 Tax=Rubinisphaera brasiliensis (strain ATCC 49424 / DSM 5305 / JCM 21570 / IAM 15109 / NBRC 103401 / IFAM 1448) TaxID=756272 RepID=F0SHT7_RUBBR|nr:pitrilysin family protein [Rubinisphaera brasiliensis]ADY59567.1 processing peptidase [Rubinisphaera brasiliensis DSM 5305]
MKFEKVVLDNGLTIVGEINPNVHSVAFGFFVRTGARDETTGVSGVSHFLEHMVFKGTETRTAADVNRLFDEVGAKYNASTSEEITLYYAAILPEYFSETFALLADIMYPSLRDDDFNIEKNVILEEIGMYDDMPAFSAYEKLMESHFRGHPLSQSILGSVESIQALTADQMRQYHREHYLAGNITLAVAGNIEWSEVLDLVNQHCQHWPAGQTERDITEATPTGGTIVIPKSGTVQEHVAQLSPAPPSASPLRFAAEILSVIVGDDSNSRLYWELIEPGDAEAAELGYNDYDGSGAFMTFLSCRPEDTARLLAKIGELYDDINQNGVTEAELEQAKNKVASRIVLRSERPMGRLSALGSNWVYRKQYRSVEDDLNTLHQLTTDDIAEMLKQYPLGQQSTVAIGPLESL